MERVKEFFSKYLHWFVVGFVGLLCLIFILVGKPVDGGYVSLTGGEVEISETTKKFIEDAQDALYRVMNQDAPTDEATIEEYEDGFEAEGLGGQTINTVLARRLPDGDDDNGKGWQCSKYTAYLATGRREYSSAHPDYGPVNGKAVAEWLVKNFGWKYIDTPVQGAIGSGGFNTQYGHTAMYLYSTGTNTAMVNDANWTPLKVGTHNMNISGWVWVVPGDYHPEPTPTPPTPTPTPVSDCKSWNLVWGDTLGYIMKTCEGSVDWSQMNSYAQSWVDSTTGKTVWEGWNSYSGIGLYAGHTIMKK